MRRLLLLLSLFACGPALANDPEAWRATQPGPGPEVPWAAPEAKTFTLTNGIPVYLVENPSLPLVTVNVVMLFGREANPAGQAGLAALTATMLDEGTVRHTGSELAAALAGLGAELSVAQHDETAVVSLDALTDDTLAPSLDLLADVVLRPRFDRADFARVRGQALTAIQSARSEPRDVANRVVAEELFGARHPYGVPSIGTEATVSPLSLADAKKFHRTWWHARNAAIVVSGQATEGELTPLLEARFGSWKRGKAHRSAVAAPSVPLRTRVVFVEQPGSVQTVLRVGTIGVRVSGPDYFPAQVAGTLLGGMFGSRLNMNLREEHGWSYGAYAGFTDHRDHGVFVARTSVQADRTADAVSEIFRELAGQAGRPVTVGELKLTHDYLLKSLPGNFETNSATAAAFIGAPNFGLDPDLWRKWAAGVEAVTAAEAEAAAKRFFDPARMVVVAVGPRSFESVDVVASLKALGHEFVEAQP